MVDVLGGCAGGWRNRRRRGWCRVLGLSARPMLNDLQIVRAATVDARPRTRSSSASVPPRPTLDVGQAGCPAARALDVADTSSGPGCRRFVYEVGSGDMLFPTNRRLRADVDGRKCLAPALRNAGGFQRTWPCRVGWRARVNGRVLAGAGATLTFGGIHGRLERSMTARTEQACTARVSGQTERGVKFEVRMNLPDVARAWF